MKFGALAPLWGRQDPFTSLQKEINRVFHDFAHGMTDLPSVWKSEGFVPRIDVVDEKDGLKITAELPGIDAKDVECSLQERTLTIKGEKTIERKEEDKKTGHYLTERAYGSFYRTIPLPYDVDREKTSAAVENGVLTIRLPKAASVKSAERKIAIQSSGEVKPGQGKKAAA
jgi:HSP20 family protein